jgi:F-type H+-transporting ATPase subunit delta
MTNVSIKNLARAIYESSKDKEGANLDIVMENSVKIISDKHLLSKSHLILSELEKIVDKENGKLRVKVSSKTKITEKINDEIVDYIKKRFKVKEVILELKENPKLLGGIKLEIGDEIIDSTLKHKLDQLQNYLITN